MYTVYKMKNELGEEVELVEKKEFDKLLQRNQEAIKFIENQYNTYPSADLWRKALKATLQGKEGASNCE